jgi:hypothetical protein
MPAAQAYAPKTSVRSLSLFGLKILPYAGGVGFVQVTPFLFSRAAFPSTQLPPAVPLPGAGVFRATGTDASGKPLDAHERFTDTWVKMPNGKWQCVASHQSRVKT